MVHKKGVHCCELSTKLEVVVVVSGTLQILPNCSLPVGNILQESYDQDGDEVEGTHNDSQEQLYTTEPSAQEGVGQVRTYHVSVLTAKASHNGNDSYSKLYQQDDCHLCVLCVCVCVCVCVWEGAGYVPAENCQSRSLK